ncbi:MAG: hypothetical protein P8169_15965, partial [Chloroflexota bacterium]
EQYVKDGDFFYPSRYRPNATRVILGIAQNMLEEIVCKDITRFSDGESVALRDEFGRPMWSGAGRRASSGEVQGGGSGQGNGRAASQTGI